MVLQKNLRPISTNKDHRYHFSIVVIDTIPVINFVIDTIKCCIKLIRDTCNAYLNRLLFVCLVLCMFVCSW